MTLEDLRYANFRTFFVLILGLALAVGVGALIGSGEFRNVKYLTFGVLFLIYALFLQNHTWKLAIFACSVDLWYVGLGFKIGLIEQTAIIAGVLWAVTWWRKPFRERPVALEHWSFGFFLSCLFIWIAYDLAHTAYNIFEPYSVRDFAMKNLLKVAVAYVLPFGLLAYFSTRPTGIVLRPNFPVRLVQIFTLGLALTIAVRIYQMASGRFDMKADIIRNESYYFQIEWLGIMENVYALRTISPLTMLIAWAFIASGWVKKHAPEKLPWFILAILLSIPGALLSGGRAVLLAILAMWLLVTFLSGRRGMVLSILASIGVGILALNLASELLKSLPLYAQRPLQMVLVNKNEAIAGTIGASTNWRLRLFHRALDEWRSDPRIFWFGRATFAYGWEDVLAQALRGEGEVLESSLRRGATHNLITDILVVFGLVGLILYLIMHAANFYFLLRVYRSPNADLAAKTLARICIVYFCYYVAFALVAGSSYPTALVWLTIMLMGYLWTSASQQKQRFTPRPTAMQFDRPSLKAPIPSPASARIPT